MSLKIFSQLKKIFQLVSSKGHCEETSLLFLGCHLKQHEQRSRNWPHLNKVKSGRTSTSPFSSFFSHHQQPCAFTELLKSSNFHHFLCLTIYRQYPTDFLFLARQICITLLVCTIYKMGKQVGKRHILTVQSVPTPRKRKVGGLKCAEASYLCVIRDDWCSVWSAMRRRTVFLTYTVAVGKQHIFSYYFWEV